MNHLIDKVEPLELSLERLFTDVPAREAWIRPLKEGVVIYGAGGLGQLAIGLLREAGVVPMSVVDRDPRVSTLQGVPVLNPGAIEPAIRENCTILVCVVTSPYAPMRDYLAELGFKDIRPFYDAAEYLIDTLHITNGWLAELQTEADIQGITRVYKALANDASRASYLQMLYWRIRREEVSSSLACVTMADKWFPSHGFPELRHDEYFVDAGAYDGEVTMKFLNRVEGRFRGVLAFEPDPENIATCLSRLSAHSSTVLQKVRLIKQGLGASAGTAPFMGGRNMASFVSSKGSEVISVVPLDDFAHEPITLVKLHLEGAEGDAIKGGMKLFHRHRPIIAATVYHKADGLWRLPAMLIDGLDDYSFIFRVHGWCGISSIIYAVPRERMERR